MQQGYASLSSTVCCPTSLLILVCGLEKQAGRCHQGTVVSSWRLATSLFLLPPEQQKKHAWPLPSPQLLSSHQQETKLWPGFRSSALWRQNSDLPPPKSLGAALWAKAMKDVHRHKVFPDHARGTEKGRCCISSPRACSRFTAQNTIYALFTA